MTFVAPSQVRMGGIWFPSVPDASPYRCPAADAPPMAPRRSKKAILGVYVAAPPRVSPTRYSTEESRSRNTREVASEVSARPMASSYEASRAVRGRREEGV